ncbi:MAG TPA: CrcB family protein [Oceanipulchritudo sp.]|nr:CrcB family protein [Oceanipulchritudo sp.]
MNTRLTGTDILYIGLGGMLGSLLRWWVGLGFEGELPVPTLLINVLGAAALGVLYASQHRLHLQGRYLYMVGFCGSFTTVSLFSLETITLFKEGALMAAVLNLSLPVLAALVIVALIIPPIEKAAERRES